MRRSRSDSRLYDDPDTDFRPMDLDPDEDDATTGDKIQLRFLMLEEKQRSDLMWRQVSALQEKVNLCINTFDPEALLKHVRLLSSLPNQNPIMAASIHSLARLRMVVQQQLRRASMRADGSLYFTEGQRASVNARCSQYFVWFFEFMDYLHELHSNFVERIFLPLFKFFHEISFLSRQGRASTSGSTFSKVSQFSAESGEMTEEGENGAEEENEDSGVSVEVVRRRAQSKTALMMLSNEFADIKTLYDTSEMDRLAQRLSFLKEQLDFMLEEEDEIDPYLFSPDSAHLLYPLRMDEGTENLVRLPVDLLVKFRKAVWLARRWLQLYDNRTHDLNTKLKKVLGLEASLTRRLQSLDGDIEQHEQQLEHRNQELRTLLQREERSEGLGFKLYTIDSCAHKLKQQIDELRRQRDAITARVKETTKRGRVEDYRGIKVEFEKNKLQRYLLERRLATLNFQKELSRQDQQVELVIRPSIMRHTDHVQDCCEQLENTLHREKRERDNIRCALLPIQEDRLTLREKLARLEVRTGSRTSREDGRASRGDSTKRGLRTGECKFIRTIHHNGHRLSLPRAPKPGWVSPPEW